MEPLVDALFEEIEDLRIKVEPSCTAIPTYLDYPKVIWIRDALRYYWGGNTRGGYARDGDTDAEHGTGFLKENDERGEDFCPDSLYFLNT